MREGAAGRRQFVQFAAPDGAREATGRTAPPRTRQAVRCSVGQLGTECVPAAAWRAQRSAVVGMQLGKRREPLREPGRERQEAAFTAPERERARRGVGVRVTAQNVLGLLKDAAGASAPTPPPGAERRPCRDEEDERRRRAAALPPPQQQLPPAEQQRRRAEGAGARAAELRGAFLASRGLTAAPAPCTPRPRPLVSVVTPTTASRHAFHETLFTCFAWQTVVETELVVVDETGEPSPFLSAVQDSRVVYMQVDPSMSIGAKRNHAIAACSGEYVAHFDDDDLYGPAYLEAMLQAIDDEDADLVKLSSWCWYDLNSRVFARFDSELDADPKEKERASRRFGYGFSYVYRRDVPVEFPDMSFGEDYAFVQALSEEGCSVALVTDAAHPADLLMLHVLHGHNTSLCFTTSRIDAKLVDRLFNDRAGELLERMRAGARGRAR